MVYCNFVVLGAMVMLTACASAPGKLNINSSRGPAQAAEGQDVILKCIFHEGSSDIYKISAEGKVQYDLETSGLAMVGRSAIVGNWLSKNTVVLNGRWSSDAVCSSESSCEYQYFTVFMNLKTGTAHEITTHYVYPEGTWKSEGKTVDCQVE